MNLSIQKESADVLLKDAGALFAAHYLEEATQPDIPLSLNEALYRRIAGTGAYQVYTMRDNGRLVGYGAFLVATGMQQQGSLQANLEAFYVDPAYRGAFAGVRLLEFIITHLKEHNVQLIHFHARPHSAMARLLEHRKASLSHYEYELRLDKE